MFRSLVLLFTVLLLLCVHSFCTASSSSSLYLPAYDVLPTTTEASFSLFPVSTALVLGSEVPVYWSFTGGNATWEANVYLIDVTAWASAAKLNTQPLTAQTGQFVWTVTAPTRRFNISHTFQLYIVDTLTRAWTYGSKFTLTTNINLEFLSPVANAVFAPNSRVALQWTGGLSQWVLQVYLINKNGNDVQAVVNQDPITNIAQTIVWTLPAHLNCSDSYLFYVQNVPTSTWTYGPEWTIQC